MEYSLQQTDQAIEDVSSMAVYMALQLSNQKAATDFIDTYGKQLRLIQTFPFACREIHFHYDGQPVRKKSFLTYHIFYIIDDSLQLITILRVLKNRQNWQRFFIIQSGNSTTFIQE